MKLISAYMLAALSGNASPAAADVKKIVTAAGATVDDTELTTLMSKLEGKNLDELITEGEAKLVALGGSGGGGAGGAAGGEAAEEEKPAEEEEEVDMGGGNLFGGDDGY